MPFIVALAVLTLLAVLAAAPIALVARANPDRRRFGVTRGDSELTDDVFTR